MSVATDTTVTTGDGRRATSAAHLSRVGLQLFFEHGFDETTVDEIADAAGIGRRTFFRYFASKNDLPWGDFDALVAQMRQRLSQTSDEVPLVDALRDAVIAFNTYPPEELLPLRQRMELLLRVPSLVAHSALRYESWRQVIAEYVARRCHLDEDDLEAQVVAWTLLATSLAAYEEWLRHEDADLLDVLDRAIRQVGTTFGG
ncbi:MAG: mycofactocin system transcriptional regulator [Nocardioides sp.]|uniref:mycofactocin system transcriptional regulator n=1 Tax=Nocardioides sp. TaxID=35761 RepID=UPI0039E56697